MFTDESYNIYTYHVYWWELQYIHIPCLLMRATIYTHTMFTDESYNIYTYHVYWWEPHVTYLLTRPHISLWKFSLLPTFSSAARQTESHCHYPWAADSQSRRRIYPHSLVPELSWLFHSSSSWSLSVINKDMTNFQSYKIGFIHEGGVFLCVFVSLFYMQKSLKLWAYESAKNVMKF